MAYHILAIDQGTTNSRAIVFNRAGRLISHHEIALAQSFPHDGWVEQDPEEMFTNTIKCCQEAIEKAKLSANDIAAIGISNQRETTILWDKSTGKAIYPAIVWQDRRTSKLCKQLETTSISEHIYHATGLLLDPYFSATKVAWVLEHVPHAREKAAKNQLLFGTVDTYLLWKLTNGKVHATDATNASRTLFFNIRTQQWDKEILAALNIPENILPIVMDNTANFGEVDKNIFGKAIPIAGMAGDQQAATIGQACFKKGMIKATYGTGCFMLLNTGESIIQSQNKLLSTIAYRINNTVTYGLEGSIFSAGTTIKWLRDNLALINTAAESESLAMSVNDNGNVYLVPAFTGLGAPYWQPDARAAILGITRNTNKAHIVRAGLESVAYQTRDLLEAIKVDYSDPIEILRVDGGMAENNWLLQFLADIIHTEVQRPNCIETSALGVAYLAGLQIGLYESLDEIAALWECNRVFKPEMGIAERDELYGQWQKAMKSCLINVESPLVSSKL